MRYRRSSKNITHARTIAMIALLSLTAAGPGCSDDSTVGLGATVSVEALMQRDATSYRARIAPAPDGARVLTWMEIQSVDNNSSRSLLARQLESVSDTGIETWFDDENANFIDFDFISGNPNAIAVTNFFSREFGQSWERWQRTGKDSEFERSDAYANTTNSGAFVHGGQGLLVYGSFGFIRANSQTEALETVYQSPDGLRSAEGYGPISGATAAGGTIFFGQNNDLLSIPIQPGAGLASPTLLFTLPSTSAIVATATQKNRLYWAEQQSDGESRSTRIHRSSFDGGDEQVILEYPNSMFELIAFRNLLCWISFSDVYDNASNTYAHTEDDQVVCADQTHGDPVVIATHTAIRSLQVVDDNHLFWIANGVVDGQPPSEPFEGPTAFWLATFSGD